MIVLIDSDVLLDVALERRPFSLPAGQLLSVLEKGTHQGFLAWHTLSNFIYLTKPSRDSVWIRGFLRDLLQFIAIVPTGTQDALSALRLPMSDMEDALQAAAALAACADVIATRNLRDYKSSPVPALAPHAVLRKLAG